MLAQGCLGHALIKEFRFDRGCDSTLSEQGSDSMGRYDLTDFEWAAIQPVLPNKPRGVPRVDDRRVLNGIFWRLRSGAPWADIPERYGPYTTCYNRFVRWRKAGVWERLMDAVTKAHDGDIQMIDSSSVRVHQHAANGKRGVEMIAWVVRGAG
jgi:transposase